MCEQFASRLFDILIFRNSKKYSVMNMRQDTYELLQTSKDPSLKGNIYSNLFAPLCLFSLNNFLTRLLTARRYA